jgi:hypothetical protein
MIGQLFSVSEQEASIGGTVPRTLLYVEPNSATVTLVERMWIKQSTQDTSENIGVQVQRATVAGTDVAVTPEPLQVGDTYGGTVSNVVTVEPTYTAADVVLDDAFNVLSGWLWTPASDDEVIVVSGTVDLGMKLITALVAAATFHYGMTLREIG